MGMLEDIFLIEFTALSNQLLWTIFKMMTIFCDTISGKCT